MICPNCQLDIDGGIDALLQHCVDEHPRMEVRDLGGFVKDKSKRIAELEAYRKTLSAEADSTAAELKRLKG